MPDFSINQRFNFLDNLTKMVIYDITPSLIVTGEGGLGKTHSVNQVIADKGLFGFEFVFSRQLEGLARPGDVLIALTTSGDSKSVMNAVDKAQELGVTSVILTSTRYSGNDGDFVLKVASEKTELIQHAHTAIGHILCELIESSSLA